MKRVLLAALIVLNMVLLVCVLHVNSPAARAQAPRGANAYLAVAARISNTRDGLYLLNLGQRKMVCFVPNVANGTLGIIGKSPSDLRHDFGRDKDRD